MMDIGYLPAPPPEEFEEDEPVEVPLPPVASSDWDHGSGSYTLQASQPDPGAAWKTAMDALNQSQPSQPGFGSYGAAPYPSSIPAQNWTQSPYGYGSQYQQAYTVPHSNMYGAQYGQGQGLGYPRHPAPYPSAAGVNPPTPQPTHRPDTHTYSIPPPQSSTASQPFTVRIPPSNGGLGRSRPVRPRYSPYAYPPPSAASASSTHQPAVYGQPSAPQNARSYQFSYTSSSSSPAAPLSEKATTALSSSLTALGPGLNDSASIDMDVEDVTPAGVGYGYNSPHQKQAPGAGGIRFQLSKKNAEVKTPNPLLQRRPGLLPVPSSVTSAPLINGNSTDSSSSTSGAPSTSSAGADLLSSVQSKDWPASLQEYVTKAIRITPADRHERVMHTITQMITTAYKTNTLYTAKWETAPMPYANESANELFGLSPKRPTDDSPSSFRSRFTSGSGRGGARGGNSRLSDNVRRGRVSGRRSSESEGESENYGYPSRFSPNKAHSGKSGGSSSVSSRWSESEMKSASPEVDYLSLYPGTVKSGANTTGKKGKLLKQGVGKNGAAATPGPRGKLLGFGSEPPQSAEDLAKLRRRQERFSAPSPASPGLKPLNKPKKAASKSPGRANGLLTPRRALSAIRTVIGTCQTVEKEYFRLTEAVDPSQVRPVSVLEEALALVKDKWKREKNYPYTESQMKSIRQDLRVQHVFSEFTVAVYETHARIALEVGDQAEFTQCLSQLEWLYDTLTAVQRAAAAQGEGGGTRGEVPGGCENRREFLSYRILYVMRQNRTTDVTRVRTQLSEADKRDTCIAFAFSVLSAYFAGDYQQFFSLYKIAPLMSGYVMEVAVPQFRQRIFVKICTAYRPNLPVSALKEILRFSSESELREFLKAYKLTYTWMNGFEEIDCKASLPVVKAGPEAVSDTPPTKAHPVSARPQSKTRRKFTSK